MNYIESLEQKGITVPARYKTFRNSEDFDGYSGMIFTEFDSDSYSATTELQFDWDEYMMDDLFDEDNPEYIPIAIIHDTDIVENAYLAIRTDDEKCAVYHCEIDDESEETEVGIIAESLEEFMEKLSYPEDNYIHYLEEKFNTALPQRYKNFMLSYEYLNYNGDMKYNDEEIFFDEFPNLQWAAENYNNDNLQWLPLASVGEEHNDYGDSLAIKVGDDDCPVYMLNGDEHEKISNSLTEFLS